MSQQAIEVLREQAQVLIRDRLAVFVDGGEIRLTNEFYRRVGTLQYGVLPRQDMGGRRIDVPANVVTLKNLYKPSFDNNSGADKKVLAKAYMEGQAIYKKLLGDLFGQDKYCSHRIKKRDSYMSVSAYSDAGMKAFTLILMTPGIEYTKLFLACILAYRDCIDITTGTIGNFFANDKWRGFYEDVVSRDNPLDILDSPSKDGENGKVNDRLL